MRKYLVKNIDCAVCAAKIENALNLETGVISATLDFSTQLLYVEAEKHVRVREIVSKADPSIVLEPFSTASRSRMAETKPFRAGREMARLLFTGALFVVVLYLDYASIAELDGTVFAVIAVGVYLLAGASVIKSAGKTVARKDFFDENVLMVIATVGAIIIGAYSEAIAVMVFYKTGEFLQNIAVYRSRRSIRSLLAQQPSFANLQTESGTVKISPESARRGDIIIVRPGEKIPLDGRVVSGVSTVDSSILTGESMPKEVEAAGDVLAGELNMTGVITVEVSRPFTESSIARMLELVENASARKSATENFITVFARYYTPAMVAIAAGLAFLPPLFIAGATFEEWIYRALILLVISCPCALVISIPLGYFGGIGRASRSGILVKGSNFLDALANIKIVVFDKTGTLTHGVFSVREVVAEEGYDPETLLSIAANAQQHSNHPIARSIVDAFESSGGRLDAAYLDAHREVPGRGIRSTFNGKTVIVGNDRLMHEENIAHGECAIEGTVAHVAVNGIYAGYILIGDRIKPDASDAIASLREHGVKEVIMLTGDNQCAADQVAARLNLDRHYAGLLPEDKVKIFEKIQSENAHMGKIAFVGDGINDAPVIARADVGVAMGALGSDAAIETADVVLMNDSPSKMAEAVSIGRQTRAIVWQNIVLALSVKAIVIALGAFGMATMWGAVFADVGTALIAVANSTRMLAGNKGKHEFEFKKEEPSDADRFSPKTA
jgi:Zn2+/Cd2+-exporting ATPase